MRITNVPEVFLDMNRAECYKNGDMSSEACLMDWTLGTGLA
jgi:hypothetical protein